MAVYRGGDKSVKVLPQSSLGISMFLKTGFIVEDDPTDAPKVANTPIAQPAPMDAPVPPVEPIKRELQGTDEDRPAKVKRELPPREESPLQIKERVVSYVKENPWLPPSTVAHVLGLDESTVLMYLERAGISYEALERPKELDDTRWRR
jgi:hypothetical protein